MMERFNLKDAHNEHGQTLLQSAAKTGHEELVAGRACPIKKFNFLRYSEHWIDDVLKRKTKEQH